MKRYLLVRSSESEVITVDDISDLPLDEMCSEWEIIDLSEEKYYRPCGWLEIDDEI